MKKDLVNGMVPECSKWFVQNRIKGDIVVTIQKCTIDDCEYLAALNKELIHAEGSVNPMTIRELEYRMKDFLQTFYEAYFFIERDRVVGYALIKMDCEPLCLRQFLIIQEYRQRHYGKQAFQMLLSYLKTDSVDIEVLSNNYQGIKFWEEMGFVERHKYMRYKNKEK